MTWGSSPVAPSGPVGSVLEVPLSLGPSLSRSLPPSVLLSPSSLRTGPDRKTPHTPPRSPRPTQPRPPDSTPGPSSLVSSVPSPPVPDRQTGPFEPNVGAPLFVQPWFRSDGRRSTLSPHPTPRALSGTLPPSTRTPDSPSRPLLSNLPISLWRGGGGW